MTTSTGQLNVTILGASGTVGHALIAALQSTSNPHFNITAVTRPASTATFPPNVTSVHADYKDLAGLTSIFTGQDVVISTVAPFGVPDQKVAIDAAVQAGTVKRFIPSEYGLDTSLEKAKEIAPFVVGKQGIVAYLREKEETGLTWTAVCSSAFFPWQVELGAGKMGWDIANGRATLFDGGTQPYDASTTEQVARAIVAVLRHPLETANAYVYIKSFTLTQRRVLDALERHSGRRYEVSHDKAVDVQREGMELVRQGDLKNGYPKITTGCAFGPWGLSEFGDKTKKWMAVLGLHLEEDKLEEIVKDCVERMGQVDYCKD